MDHDRIPETALAWYREGRGAALATVIETWGSAPRPAGSQMAVSGTGEIAGSVSGGCVEGAVVAEALAALDGGSPRVLTFGVSDGDAFAVGLACGGTIRVMVEPVGEAAPALPAGLLADLAAARAAARAVVLVTDLAAWERQLATTHPRMATDRSGVDDGRFVAVHNPPLRLIVVGAVHIAQALVPMARACGYAPVIIDPRGSFGAAARFPGEVVRDDWPDAALGDLAPDSRTAIVTLTHDPKLDDPALQVALQSPAFYVGALGSPRTHEKRLERLRAAGLDAGRIARLHAPVGLRIGAATPAEIAVSIMAEITQVLRRG
jgi:xanthine dehydrogenase accessory factor